MTKSLQPATLGLDASPQAVVETLNREGIAILPGYFDSATVRKLNAEFESFLETAEHQDSEQLNKRPEGVTLPVIRNHMDVATFPVSADVFSSPFMREISVAYLETDEIGLNHQIYVNLNKGTDAPVDRLPFVPHFDKISTFKFFVYLTDTTAENGAMGVDLGSQIANRRARADALAKTGNTNDIKNILPDAQMIPVEGIAGTMFIFDTDTTHAAGFVQQGQERRVMRGHTRTIEVLRAHRLEHQAA